MTDGTFVGRRRELSQLTDVLAAVHAGTPSTVLLAGEAGVGKTRLVREFTEAARARGAHVLAGACIELGDALPYAPLIEALRRLVRDNGEAQVRRLAGPAWNDLAVLVADFTGADAGGPPVGAPGSQLRVFGAVLRLLDHLGTDAPVVLVFEDLHWADQSTLDLLSYLVSATSNQRMLLIGSHRTGLSRSHPLRILLAEPRFTRRILRIDLARFAERELWQFLQMNGPIPGELLQRYFDLSEGNAFFAEQLVASGALTGGGHRRVPESLSELMLTRIRLLGPEATRLIRVAAIAGRQVSDRLLTSVSGLGDEALDRALQECVDEGMLVVDPTDEDLYVFRHALLREAVYENLVPRERRRLHAAMAEAINADRALGFVDDMTAAVELAYHWFSAGRKPQALAATVRAGDATARARAFREAETQYKRSLHLWTQVPDAQRVAGTTRDRILEAAADAARWAGHVSRGVEYMASAVREVDPVVDPGRAGELYERLGSYRWEAGAADQSLVAYREAERLLAGRPCGAVHARLLSGLAMAALRVSRYAEGLELAQRAVEVAVAVGAAAEHGRALNTNGLALTMLGQPEEGVRLLREAVRIAEQVDHLETLFRAYGNLGFALLHAGQLAASVEETLYGLGLARKFRLANTRQGGILANNAGASLFLLGRWDEAVELLDEALRDNPRVTESAYLRLTRAEIDVARGRFEAAEALLGDIHRQPYREPRFLQSLYACLAELAIWRGDPLAACGAVDRGVNEAAETEDVLVQLRLYAVGLRAAADVCRVGADPEAVDRVAALGARVAAVTGRGVGAVAEIDVLARLCAAERARAAGTDTVRVWRAVAAGWDELDRPYPAGYARWRETAAAIAAGDTAYAGGVARAALATAVDLAAQPLLTEVEKLIAVVGPDGSTGDIATTVDRFRLTARELEVLTELVAGLTYRRIGAKLFIDPKTVSTHVHNILRKLGAENRSSAALIALRAGIVALPGESAD